MAWATEAQWDQPTPLPQSDVISVLPDLAYFQDHLQVKSPDFTNIGSSIPENILNKMNQSFPWAEYSPQFAKLRGNELCLALGSADSAKHLQWETEEQATRWKVLCFYSSTHGASCGFPLTLPCLLGPICCVLPFLSDGLPEAWQSSLFIPSVFIPFNQVSEHNLWYFPSLACSHIDASNLCHSEYPKLLQM